MSGLPKSLCVPEKEGVWNIHAYPDELSQQYAGADGAHRMKEALAVVGFKYETEDNRNATEVAKSRSIPRLTINGWGSSCVAVNGTQATVSISGEVRDSMADLVQSPIMKQVHIYHENTLVGSIALQVVSDGTSDWKPFAKHFTFSGSVTISAWDGVHNLEVVTDANEMGVRVVRR